ncbi:MAG: sulfide/dihydroorotate dehydrogenase-like FAD/NAD-binding protein [Promethearchaeota archaeon]
MFKIISTKQISSDIYEFVIQAPEIAAKVRPGQFLIYRLHNHGERIPLTFKDWDVAKGTITIVFQTVGKSTKELAKLKPGDGINDIIGPLGTAPSVEKYGTVVVVAGGCGAAPSLPRTRQLKEAGNYIITILGARSENLLVCELELSKISDEIYITTDDGSKGIKGLVTNKLKEILDEGRQIDYVFTVGPPIMMKFVAATTKPFGVKTECSLNPIMVDGTGMCGACRVEVAGETKFACVDGPEFDAHQVNFDLLMKRLGTYITQEKTALERYEHTCASGTR